MLALRTARTARTAHCAVQRLSRRNASTHAAHDTHAADPTVHHHEGFGKGFYLSIAGVVGTLALYKLDKSSNAGGESFITRMITKYHSRQEVWEARNSLRTTMLEQASADKSLFECSPRSSAVPYKYPETLNMSSPNNRVAGYNTRNHILATVREKMEAERERHAAAVALAR